MRVRYVASAFLHYLRWPQGLQFKIIETPEYAGYDRTLQTYMRIDHEMKQQDQAQRREVFLEVFQHYGPKGYKASNIQKISLPPP